MLGSLSEVDDAVQEAWLRLSRADAAGIVEHVLPMPIYRLEREVRSGFGRAVKEARRGQVVVESFVTGNDYRVLVVGGRMVAVAQRVPAHVIGDAIARHVPIFDFLRGEEPYKYAFGPEPQDLFCLQVRA